MLGGHVPAVALPWRPCFVVPNLPRSRLQPFSVRFRNLATLSSAAARWIFDLTWISRTIYAFPATWLSFGSFRIFRAFRLAGSCDRGALRGPRSWASAVRAGGGRRRGINRKFNASTLVVKRIC